MGKRGFGGFFLSKQKNALEKEEIAKLLKVSPEVLQQFEEAYHSVLENEIPEGYFEYNAKQATERHSGLPAQTEGMDDIIERIVEELIDQTPIWKYDGISVTAKKAPYRIKQGFVTNNDLKCFPEKERPMLTGKLIKKDINREVYPLILNTYCEYRKEKDPYKKIPCMECFVRD